MSGIPRTLALLLGLVWTNPRPAPAQPPSGHTPAPAPAFERFETPYYFIYTDLNPADAAEAVVRLKVLPEFYRKQTRALGFTARIDRRLPVYLYKNRADYLATGAPPESAGAFLGDRLVAAATDRGGSPAWHVVQHEAFHQFAAAARGPDLPGWLNEGLGEYFGEAIFTGDGYVTGVIPPWRAARVKKRIDEGVLKPLEELLRMSQDDWNAKVDLANYDQAWSVVQFILRDDSAGRARLAKYIKVSAAGKRGADAFAEAFGDLEQFRRGWSEWWQADRANGPAPGWQVKASVATAASFLARATARGHTFRSFDHFVAACRQGEVRLPPEDWLPPWMLEAAVRALPEDTRWELRRDGEFPSVFASLPKGRTASGTFKLRDGKVVEVAVGESAD